MTMILVLAAMFFSYWAIQDWRAGVRPFDKIHTHVRRPAK